MIEFRPGNCDLSDLDMQPIASGGLEENFPVGRHSVASPLGILAGEFLACRSSSVHTLAEPRGLKDARDRFSPLQTGGVVSSPGLEQGLRKTWLNIGKAQ